MLLEEEYADPEALAEILLETCKSVTHSLGECHQQTLISSPNFIFKIYLNYLFERERETERSSSGSPPRVPQ